MRSLNGTTAEKMLQLEQKYQQLKTNQKQRCERLESVLNSIKDFQDEFRVNRDPDIALQIATLLEKASDEGAYITYFGVSNKLEF